MIYEPPSAAEKARAAEIRATVRELFADAIDDKGEDLFEFVKTLP